MNDPPKETEDRELIDMLIAISVVSRHLARKLEMKGSEEATRRNPGFLAKMKPDGIGIRRASVGSLSITDGGGAGK